MSLPSVNPLWMRVICWVNNVTICGAEAMIVLLLLRFNQNSPAGVGMDGRQILDYIERLPGRYALLVVGILALVAFSNSLGNQFVWDDHYSVEHNEAIRDPGNIPGFFMSSWAAEAGQERARSKNAGYWRPVAQVSYTVDYALSGLMPGWFHGVSVILHVIVSMLVLLLGWRLFPGPGSERVGVIAAAALFAVHPVHSEAVCVITYRTDILAALFFMAGLLSWTGLKKERTPGSELSGKLVWAPLFYFLGVGSKEMAVTLPAVILLYEVVVRQTRLVEWRKYILLAPVILVGLGYMVLRKMLLQPSPYTFFTADTPWYHVLFTMFEVFSLYVRMLLVPWPLTPFYDWSILPPRESLFAPPVIAGLVLLAGWFGIILWSWKRHREIAFLLLFYLVILLPVSQLVPIVVAAADRFLYLAMAGPLMAGSVVLCRAFRNRGQSALLVFVAGLLLVFSSLSIVRNTDWRSDRSILEASVRDWPGSFNAWYGLAQIEEQEGNYLRAAELYEKLHRPEEATAAREKQRY
jgi:protein O-mannosyl-transferase